MIICLDIGGSGIKGAAATSPTELRSLGRVPTPLHDFAAFAAAIKAMADLADPVAPIAISITGVGGGIVVDGHILNGAGGFAGEWGHGPVAATSAGNPPVEIPRIPCGCGQVGCVDTVGAARGMERLHKHLHGIDLPSTAIVEAWLAGDAQAARTINVQIDLLAGPLALVINVVGASIVPVGGGLGKVPRFIELLDIAVRQRILRRLTQPLVVPARLTGESGLVGAAILGFSELSS